MPERIFVSLEITPCRLLAVVLLVMYLAAAGAVLAVDLPLGLRAGLVVLIAIAGFSSLRRHALLSCARACVWLRIRDDGECLWRSRDGTEHAATLLPRWFTSPWLTVLRVGGGRPGAIDLVLTPCKVGAEAHRRLRVLLRNRL